MLNHKVACEHTRGYIIIIHASFADLHYLSPSGCTFWGKKPWSRKKKLICQLGTLVGAPVGIALLAGISV